MRGLKSTMPLMAALTLSACASDAADDSATDQLQIEAVGPARASIDELIADSDLVVEVVVTDRTIRFENTGGDDPEAGAGAVAPMELREVQVVASSDPDSPQVLSVLQFDAARVTTEEPILESGDHAIVFLHHRSADSYPWVPTPQGQSAFFAPLTHGIIDVDGGAAVPRSAMIRGMDTTDPAAPPDDREGVELDVDELRSRLGAVGFTPTE